MLALVLVMPAMADTIWATAQGELDGQPMVYRFVERLPSGFDTASQPERVDILWAYADGRNGMPGSETNARQIRFEDLMERIDSSLATLVLVRAGADQKDWVYYTSDTEQFMRRLNEELAGEPRFPIEIIFEQDPDWSLYWNFWNGVDRSSEPE